MKKSLILSIVMTLVLVISMSTATFAWYTANTEATATVSTITAATASGDLKVAFKSNKSNLPQDAAYEVEYVAAGTLNPAAPQALLTADTVKTADWLTGTTKAEGFEGSDATYTESEYGVITLSNTSTSPTNAITMTVTVSGDTDLDDNVEIIVVCAGNIIYNTAYAYGTDGTAAGNAEAVTTGAIAALGSKGSVDVEYYIWFDGYAMDNSDMGKAINVEFAFSAAAQA